MSSYLSSLKVYIIIGMVSINAKKSLTLWHISTPLNPHICGNIIINGIKNNPCLAAASVLARHGFRQVCAIILLTNINAFKGRTII